MGSMIIGAMGGATVGAVIARCVTESTAEDIGVAVGIGAEVGGMGALVFRAYRETMDCDYEPAALK